MWSLRSAAYIQTACGSSPDCVGPMAMRLFPLSGSVAVHRLLYSTNIEDIHMWVRGLCSVSNACIKLEKKRTLLIVAVFGNSMKAALEGGTRTLVTYKLPALIPVEICSFFCLILSPKCTRTNLGSEILSVGKKRLFLLPPFLFVRTSHPNELLMSGYPANRK